MPMIDLVQAAREELRWLILRALHMAQEIGASEGILRNAIEPAMPSITALEVRRALDYLEERKVINPIYRDAPYWVAKINRYGIDLVEYKIPCEPGIARPKPW